VVVFGSRVYVSNNQESGKVLVVDFLANPPAVTGSVNTGGRPQGMVADEQGVRIYVLDKRNPAGVTVIDGLSSSRSESIEIAGREDLPRAIALIPETAFGRKLLVMAFYQDVVFYDLDLEMVVGEITVSDDASARSVNVSVSLDGSGVLVGLERAELGKRLIFWKF
jgi:DNA-binding beta-propeller fold protein YncE